MTMKGNAREAEAIIARLDLQPHPEGGYYRETWRHEPEDGGRGVKTAIYYLLRRGQRSAWHRVDAVEIWHYYAGAPLELTLSCDGVETTTHRLGVDFDDGQEPQAVVPAGAWQTAESLGDWTLVGCTVAPAFVFEGFELAPPGWAPAKRR
jgi:predicted cupin superfamily sugar epimerase